MRYALVVDDENFTATLIKVVLEEHDFIVETASNGAEAVEVLKDYEPDVAIIDLHLGQGPSGFDVARVVEEKHPYSAIVLLSQYEAANYVGFGYSEAPAGATFIPKDQIKDTKMLVASINKAIKNPQSGSKVPDYAPFAVLSDTELEVLQYAAQGLTNTEIAKRRDTTSKAVERVITSIYRALEIDQRSIVNPRTELVRMYVKAAGLPNRDQL